MLVKLYLRGRLHCKRRRSFDTASVRLRWQRLARAQVIWAATRRRRTFIVRESPVCWLAQITRTTSEVQSVLAPINSLRLVASQLLELLLLQVFFFVSFFRNSYFTFIHSDDECWTILFRGSGSNQCQCEQSICAHCNQRRCVCESSHIHWTSNWKKFEFNFVWLKNEQTKASCAGRTPCTESDINAAADVKTKIKTKKIKSNQSIMKKIRREVHRQRHRRGTMQAAPAMIASMRCTPLGAIAFLNSGNSHSVFFLKKKILIFDF